MPRQVRVFATLSAALFAATLSAALTDSAATAVDPDHDWSAYRHDAGHSSFAATERAITPRNVAALGQVWRWHAHKSTQPGQPPALHYASPTVADGAVFLGSNSGWFYKLDLASGVVLAKVFLCFAPALTCPAQGVISTATVAADPGDGEDTVYVAAPDGYLYAL